LALSVLFSDRALRSSSPSCLRLMHFVFVRSFPKTMLIIPLFGISGTWLAGLSNRFASLVAKFNDVSHIFLKCCWSGRYGTAGTRTMLSFWTLNMSKLRCHLSVGVEPDCGEFFSAELTKFGVSAVFTVVSFQLVFLSPPSSVL
jgi:hypothetical protein